MPDNGEGSHNAIILHQKSSKNTEKNRGDGLSSFQANLNFLSVATPLCVEALLSDGDT